MAVGKMQLTKAYSEERRKKVTFLENQRAELWILCFYFMLYYPQLPLIPYESLKEFPGNSEG